MPIALYMDEHVPGAITVQLRIRGVDVLTAQEDEREGTLDPLLLDRAAELSRVMFSFDGDMLAEANRRQTKGTPFTGVLFAHPTRISVGECIRDLEIVAKAGQAQDFLNTVLYLPL